MSQEGVEVADIPPITTVTLWGGALRNVTWT